MIGNTGLKRVESLVLALMIALPAGFLAFGEAPAVASGYEEEDEEEGEGGGAPRVQAAAVKATPAQAAADATAATAWKTECGSCHVPFPPRLLPAASWQKIMGDLGNHYGSDATLDDAALVRQISGYLAKNAGDPGRYVDSKGAAVPLRITQTRWFLREHDEVRADAWARPSIKSPANCGACHQGAADGNFSERGIRIPKQ